jgi:DNA-directed RNA polymerase sigma subunit (sigma70/sigma32)
MLYLLIDSWPIRSRSGLSIEQSLSCLQDKQAEVLKLFFGIGVEQAMSLEDISERYDLTKERVRQDQRQGHHTPQRQQQMQNT